MAESWRIGTIVGAQKKKEGVMGVIKRDDGVLLSFTEKTLSKPLRYRFVEAENLVGLGVEFLPDGQGGIKEETIFKRKRVLM